MTPLPFKTPEPAAQIAPAALRYIAQHIEAFVWHGYRPAAGKAKLLASVDQRPCSAQAERAIRMRENPVTYTLTGHPLRRVDRAPGRGEYRFHAEDGRVEISDEDAAASVTVRAPTQ